MRINYFKFVLFLQIYLSTISEVVYQKKEKSTRTSNDF